MKRFYCPRDLFVILAISLGFLFYSGESAADPSKYPQYAQQQLPAGIAPDFVNLDQLVEQITGGKKPLIIDVRTREEYEEAHIKASVSIPLGEIPLHLAEIPKDKLVVLY
jgi:hypothetical protein